MGDISAQVKDDSRNDRLTDPVLFWRHEKKVRIEVDNATTWNGLLSGLHLFMRFVSGRAIYEKENLNKLGEMGSGASTGEMDRC